MPDKAPAYLGRCLLCADTYCITPIESEDLSPRVHDSAIEMHSLLTKAKDLGLKGREKLEQYSSGKLGSDEGSREGSPSFSRKRREAALKADLFAGPDKIVSAGNTYGLIKLTVHEAKVPSEQRYCAVVSIGMQVNEHLFILVSLTGYVVGS